MGQNAKWANGCCLRKYKQARNNKTRTRCDVSALRESFGMFPTQTLNLTERSASGESNWTKLKIGSAAQCYQFNTVGAICCSNFLTSLAKSNLAVAKQSI